MMKGGRTWSCTNSYICVCCEKVTRRCGFLFLFCVFIRWSVKPEREKPFNWSRSGESREKKKKRSNGSVCHQERERWGGQIWRPAALLLCLEFLATPIISFFSIWMYLSKAWLFCFMISLANWLPLLTSQPYSLLPLFLSHDCVLLNNVCLPSHLSLTLPHSIVLLCFFFFSATTRISNSNDRKANGLAKY